MHKIGNIADLIDTQWIDAVLAEINENQGILRPKEGGKPKGLEGDKEWQKAIAAGYSSDDVYFEMFDKNTLKTEIPVFHTCSRNRHWWITKMMPGQFMPMHIDPHTEQQKNVDRFWIPLQNWEPGHIFMFENTFIANYAKGDVYKYESAQGLHGAANIGLASRSTLQVTLYDE